MDDRHRRLANFTYPAPIFLAISHAILCIYVPSHVIQHENRGQSQGIANNRNSLQEVAFNLDAIVQDCKKGVM